MCKATKWLGVALVNLDAHRRADVSAVARNILDVAEPVEPADRQAINEAFRNGSTDPVLHAAALWMAYDAGAGLRLNRSHARSWIPGVHELIHSGHLDAAAYALTPLRAAFPDVPYLDNMDFIFRHLPPAVGNGRRPFVDDRSRDVQAVEMPGADTVLLAFCGGSHQLGMPNNLLDRWFARLNTHVIYLRDRQKNGYANGIAALGRNRTTTIKNLGRLATDIGARRIVCLGHSVGGTGALRYASELGADRVLALSPMTGTSDGTATAAPGLAQNAASVGCDLVPLYRDGHGVRAHIVYGEKHEGDREHCARMRGLPGVTVEALAGWESHHIMGELVRTGRLNKFLAWLVIKRP